MVKSVLAEKLCRNILVCIELHEISSKSQATKQPNDPPIYFPVEYQDAFSSMQSPYVTKWCDLANIAKGHNTIPDDGVKIFKYVYNCLVLFKYLLT